MAAVVHQLWHSGETADAGLRCYGPVALGPTTIHFLSVAILALLLRHALPWPFQTMSLLPDLSLLA